MIDAKQIMQKVLNMSSADPSLGSLPTGDLQQIINPAVAHYFPPSLSLPSYLWETHTLLQTSSELWWLSEGKRGDYQNCSVLYFVLKLCIVISTLRWEVLTVLWIGFCHTGPISLCVDWFICVYLCVLCVFVSYCTVVVILWAWWDGPDGIEA